MSHVTAEVQRIGGWGRGWGWARRSQWGWGWLLVFCNNFFSSFLVIQILSGDMATQDRLSLLTSFAARCGQWLSSGQWERWIRLCGSQPFSSLFFIIPSCILMFGMLMPPCWTIRTGPWRLLKADCLLVQFVYVAKPLLLGVFCCSQPSWIMTNSVVSEVLKEVAFSDKIDNYIHSLAKIAFYGQERWW